MAQLNESQMNRLGYQLLQKGRVKEAIEIFKLNVEDFPNSSNVYDSLGEAYMVNGDKELAIRNYRKSIELNPQNDNGKEMLKKLEEN
jgi:Flp pilus assembly protein TadD